MNTKWSKNLRDLLPKLLSKDPIERMKWASQIKSHPWFGILNWDDLLNKKVKIFYEPIIKEETDVSNFAAEFTNMSPVSNTDSLSEYTNYQGFSFEKSTSPISPPLKLS